MMTSDGTWRQACSVSGIQLVPLNVLTAIDVGQTQVTDVTVPTSCPVRYPTYTSSYQATCWQLLWRQWQACLDDFIGAIPVLKMLQKD